jgi:hypothetical protein
VVAPHLTFRLLPLQEREAEARQEHEQMREEIRNRNLEEINVLRITLDTQIEELEQHFETAHINYLQNTDQRTTDFKYLTAKDHELSHEIEIKIRRIERLQVGIQTQKKNIRGFRSGSLIADRKSLFREHCNTGEERLPTILEITLSVMLFSRKRETLLLRTTRSSREQ